MRTKFAGYALMLFPLVLHAARLDQNPDQALRISASGTGWPVTALVPAAEPAQTAGPQ